VICFSHPRVWRIRVLLHHQRPGIVEFYWPRYRQSLFPYSEALQIGELQPSEFVPRWN
jgi:hypothetical protein